MSPYQNMYWQSEEIRDDLFKMEKLIVRRKKHGQACEKYEREYHLLLDELRKLQSKLNLYDRCA